MRAEEVPLVAPVVLVALASRAASIEGHVEGPGGVPVSGAAIIAYDLHGTVDWTWTDDDGAYRLGPLETTSWRLGAVPPDDVDAVARWWRDTWVFCEAEPIGLQGGEDVLGVDFALSAGGVLTGRVLDPEGQPLPGAAVTAQGADDRTWGLERGAITAGDGTFAVTGLDAPRAGSGAWRVLVEAEGLPDQAWDGAWEPEDSEPFRVARRHLLDVGDILLRPGVAARGTVRGPGGPIDGAGVHLYGLGQVVNAISTADGAWSAAAVPPGDLLVWADADGHATTWWPDADRPSDWISAPDDGDVVEGVDLDLPAEATLSGRLTGPDDGRDVSIVLYNDTFTVGRGAAVAQDGSFTLDTLGGGTWALHVWASDVGYRDDWIRDAGGGIHWFQLEPSTGNEAGVLPLPPGARVSGTILDDDGDPVDGADVIVEDPDSGDAWSATSAADGTWSVAGLPPDRLVLSAHYSPMCRGDPGWAAAWWDGARRPEDATPVEVAEGRSLGGLDLVLPVDDDHDGMADAWEREHGLDPDRDDAGEDPDGDGYTNLVEYLADSDPHAADGGPCGCATGGPRGAGGLAFLGLLAAFAGRREVRSGGSRPRGRVRPGRGTCAGRR